MAGTRQLVHAAAARSSSQTLVAEAPAKNKAAMANISSMSSMNIISSMHRFTECSQLALFSAIYYRTEDLHKHARAHTPSTRTCAHTHTRLARGSRTGCPSAAPTLDIIEGTGARCLMLPRMFNPCPTAEPPPKLLASLFGISLTRTDRAGRSPLPLMLPASASPSASPAISRRGVTIPPLPDTALPRCRTRVPPPPTCCKDVGTGAGCCCCS